MSKCQFRSASRRLLSLFNAARARGQRLSAALAFAALFVVLAGGDARAQSPNCDALVPSGGDDAPAINNCLLNSGRAILSASVNDFKIFEPIRIVNLPGRTLAGAGRDATKIRPYFSCGDPRFLNGSAFKIPIEVRQSSGSVVKNFHLDLDQLRKDCGHGGNFAITINKSGGSQVTDLRITGSRYNSLEYTSGWAHGAGVSVVNSDNSYVTGNVIKDLGYAGSFAGAEAISVANSKKTTVQNNTITRVAFGIVVTNKPAAEGFTGDASNTVVTGNSITGASQIGCPDCSQGRAIKLQACTNDAQPLRNVTVTYNSASNYGGQSGGHAVGANGQGGTGLMVLCGVQYSKFENNVFNNAPFALQGLFINSVDTPTLKKATHHNTFNNNTFESGRGSGYCNGDCSDVEFGTEGPDQIGISRGSAGTNTLKPLPTGFGYGYAIRVRFTRGCSQYSHAWFVYPPGQNFIYRGQSLTLAGAGVRPPDFFSVITFSFRNATGIEVASFTSPRSQSNCVVDQRPFTISATQFAPGKYTVYAKYYDGNAADVFIQDDPIGTLDVR
ncbi:MAG: hypothetical protein M3416_08485 [Acidobacteriota bacterium]|nr:hypothetical protein [Acidobacteriota bacterium]